MKLQDYDFILCYILQKTNTKANILLRKDQVNTKYNTKDVQMLKNKIWTRRSITAEVTFIQKSQVVEVLNNIKEQEVLKELEKDKRQV